MKGTYVFPLTRKVGGVNYAQVSILHPSDHANINFGMIIGISQELTTSLRNLFDNLSPSDTSQASQRAPVVYLLFASHYHNNDVLEGIPSALETIFLGVFQN